MSTTVTVSTTDATSSDTSGGVATPTTFTAGGVHSAKPAEKVTEERHRVGCQEQRIKHEWQKVHGW
jgi:hypothetical protein